MKHKTFKMMAACLTFCFFLSHSVYEVSAKKKAPLESYLDFSFRFLKETVKKDENTLISPLSVFYAMGMTANGAKGETLREIENVFRMHLKGMNDFGVKHLNAKKELKLANGIWFKDDPYVKTKKSFLDKTKKIFGATVKKAPFNEKTLKDINQWVDKKTKGMIKNMLDKLDKDAVMYLVNALSFEGKWETGYAEHQVREGVFTTYTGKKKKLPLMYSEESIFLKDEKVTGFIKPYKDSDFAFLLLLPNEGGDVLKYAKNFTRQDFNKLMKNMNYTPVQTAIPAFEAAFEAELNEAFESMGIKRAFTDKADFSGMVKAKVPVGISRVLHKTFIKVDKSGTKAGASTVVEMMKMTSILEPESVIADRPFLYMIVDMKEKMPVFIGTMLEP